MLRLARPPIASSADLQGFPAQFLAQCGNICARQTSASLLVPYQVPLSKAEELGEILLPTKADDKNVYKSWLQVSSKRKNKHLSPAPKTCALKAGNGVLIAVRSDFFSLLLLTPSGGCYGHVGRDGL